MTAPPQQQESSRQTEAPSSAAQENDRTEFSKEEILSIKERIQKLETLALKQEDQRKQDNTELRNYVTDETSNIKETIRQLEKKQTVVQLNPEVLHLPNMVHRGKQLDLSNHNCTSKIIAYMYIRSLTGRNPVMYIMYM